MAEERKDSKDASYVKTLMLYVHVFKALFIRVQMNVWPTVDFVVWEILVGPFSEEWYRWREATSLRESEKA